MIFPTFFLDIKNSRVYDEQGRFIAIYFIKSKAVIQNRKNVFRC